MWVPLAAAGSATDMSTVAMVDTAAAPGAVALMGCRNPRMPTRSIAMAR